MFVFAFVQYEVHNNKNVIKCLALSYSCSIFKLNQNFFRSIWLTVLAGGRTFQYIAMLYLDMIKV